MENKVVFFDSMGRNEELRSAEWFKDKVFNAPDDFWKGETGECALSYKNTTISATMGLVGRENAGFMAYHRYSTNNDLFKSLRYGEHTGETVEAEIGGNPDLYYKE